MAFKKLILFEVLLIFFMFFCFKIAKSETIQENFENWVAEVMIDDFTDESTIGIATRGDINPRAYFYLNLSADEKWKKIGAIFLSFDDYVCGSERYDDMVEVKFRVDKNEIIEEKLHLAKNQESGYRWTDRKKIQQLINEMFEGETLLIRVDDDICGETNDYKFLLGGMRESYNFALSKI